jgi:hypothetical protein
MDDFNSADVVSITPSIASELSSFAAFSDDGNEAAATDGGHHVESGAGEVTRHPLFWFENDIVNVQVRGRIDFSMRPRLMYFMLRSRTSRSRSTRTCSLANPTKEGLS